MKKINLSKQHKILLVLLELSGVEKKNIKFEDIVIALFQKFPQDFHLKGYENYPDSGDMVKRPLYTLRDNGLLTVRNMIFSLTDKGLNVVERIKGQVGGKKIEISENFDRYIEKEFKRIENLNSFKLFIEKRFDNILDTDFFDYLGTSVKAEKNDFKSRLNIMIDIVKILEKQRKSRFKILLNFHNFMFNKFRKEIDYKINN